MSLDRSDIAYQTQQSQHGSVQNSWPVIIDPSTLGPGNTPVQVGQEYEVSITPCDALILPTFYDQSLGLNPCQVKSWQTSVPSTYDPVIMYDGPNFVRGLYRGLAMGVNVFDVWDGAYQDQSSPFGPLAQGAPIFSLRFNSISAPWTIWSLSNMTSLSGVGQVYWGYPPNSGSFSPTYQVGRGDAMRSITGPINRLWYKLLAPALVWSSSIGAVGENIQASRVVMLSFLGMNPQLSGLNFSAFSNTDVGTTNLTQPTGDTVTAGGYVTPQINTLARLELERLGLGQRTQP